MKVKGFRVVQGESNFCVGLVKAKDLVQKVDDEVWAPDIWRVANPDGYQRSLSEARAREFGRFILKGGVSPLSILLNFREGTVKTADGHLELPDGPAFIVDGQHRAAGWLYALEQNTDMGESEIPLIVMNVPDRYEEARQFVIINRTAKGVRTDLTERFLLQAVRSEGRAVLVEKMESGILRKVLRNVEWVTKAVEIVDALNSDKTSCWYRRVRLPNEPRNSSIVAQKSLTDSLEPILKDTYFQGKDVKVIAAALRNYWEAIRELCEAAFDEPQEYVLQKTTGVGVIHKVFPRVSELCTDGKGNRVLTTEMIKTVLDGLPQMMSGYWSTDGEAGRRGTGKKAVAVLAMEFLEALESKQQRQEQQLIV